MKRPELVCPAGTPAALRAAIEAGADSVYCGLQNATNARNFPGLNFTEEEFVSAVAHAHGAGAKVMLAVNTFPPAGKFGLWQDAIGLAARTGADAAIVADIGVAEYAARTHPGLRLHLSVQAAAASPEAIRYYCREFGIRRAVLPRILTVAEIRALKAEIPCEIETFVFGNHGMMIEGRCSLTNYLSGQSTNMDGVCTPAADVRFERDKEGMLTATLCGHAIDRYPPGQQAGYPTICKGRYLAPGRNEAYYAFEEPDGLNLAGMLPELIKAGVDAFKIEGRQRSRAYVRSVVSTFRAAVDTTLRGGVPDAGFLASLAEGQKQSEGAFKTKKWR